jgi:multiple sugar transport system permease protein
MSTAVSTETRAAAPQAKLSRRALLWQNMKKEKAGYWFFAPFALLFFIFYVLPVITSVYLSFTYFNVLEPPRWIGWSNYKLLFVDDDVFLIAIRNTLAFAIATGPIGYFLAFILAWAINQLPKKIRPLFTLAFYAPSITSAIAVGVVWMYIFSGDSYGLINYTLIKLGMINEPLLWLQDPKTMMPVIIFVALWMSMGTGFLAFLAGLTNVPAELYEAGRIDGISNRGQEIWYITLPSMKPQLLFGAVITVVNSFSVAGLTMQMAGFPSPLYAAHTILTHLFDYAFVRFEMGYSAAISVVLFVLMFGLSRLLTRLLSSKGE